MYPAFSKLEVQQCCIGQQLDDVQMTSVIKCPSHLFPARTGQAHLSIISDMHNTLPCSIPLFLSLGRPFAHLRLYSWPPIYPDGGRMLDRGSANLLPSPLKRPKPDKKHAHKTGYIARVRYRLWYLSPSMHLQAQLLPELWGSPVCKRGVTSRPENIEVLSL